MGVDLDLYLPAQTSFRDFADALATLFGHPTKYVNHGTYESCDVDGIEVDDKQHTPTCISFYLAGPDGKKYKHVLWQYESSGHPKDMIGPRVVLMSANAVNIAAARRLVRFFGGALCENDSEGEIAESHPAKYERAPSDGMEWRDYERLKSEITPLTKSEIEKAREVAAYSDSSPPEMIPWLVKAWAESV